MEFLIVLVGLIGYGVYWFCFRWTWEETHRMAEYRQRSNASVQRTREKQHVGSGVGHQAHSMPPPSLSPRKECQQILLSARCKLADAYLQYGVDDTRNILAMREKFGEEWDKVLFGADCKYGRQTVDNALMHVSLDRGE